MVGWSQSVQVVGGEREPGSQLGGGGAGGALLAFSGSPRISKFFSNLQLLDVEANHQRGSPCADSPRRPSPPPTPNLPPLERRLVQASSLIHVFIYYFIDCV